MTKCLKCFSNKITPTNVYLCNELVFKIEYNLEFKYINDSSSFILNDILKNKISISKNKNISNKKIIIKYFENNKKNGYICPNLQINSKNILISSFPYQLEMKII